MARRPLVNTTGPAMMFRMPNIVGTQYRPGRQPNAPGESQIDGNTWHFMQIPWPNAVPSLLALANNPGIPRARALGIVNNSTSSLPMNNLFIAGFSQKSRG